MPLMADLFPLRAIAAHSALIVPRHIKARPASAGLPFTGAPAKLRKIYHATTHRFSDA